MNAMSLGLEKRKGSSQFRVSLTGSYSVERNWPEVENGWILKFGVLF